MNNAIDTSAPAHLWIGSSRELEHKTISFLQKILCATHCGTCNICIKIVTRQHHAAIWLTPEKQYTLDQLNVIFSTMSFALDAQEQRFFILQHADFLTPTCANALLKPLEEPPHGYHFLLLAQRQERILPTIRSRCLVQVYATKQEEEYEQLLRHFKMTNSLSAQQFLSDLESIKPNERTCLELLDALLAMWSSAYKKVCIQSAPEELRETIAIINVIRTAYTQLPMPGSAKLFLKDLYLQIRSVKK